MFDIEFAREILPTLLRASVVTVYATLGGFALALVGGLVLAFGQRARFRAIRLVTSVYIEVVRNTPFLIQLFFLFFVLPSYGIRLPAIATGIVALGLNFSPYLCEVYRSGIEAVPRAQWDAAVALNFSTGMTWRRVILPVAVPPLVPVFGNYLIAMFKESALLSTIAVVELTGAARNVGGISYQYYEPLTLVGIVYLVISVVASVLIRRIEVRTNVRR